MNARVQKELLTGSFDLKSLKFNLPYNTLFQIHAQSQVRHIRKPINHLQAAVAQFALGD